MLTSNDRPAATRRSIVAFAVGVTLALSGTGMAYAQGAGGSSPVVAQPAAEAAEQRATGSLALSFKDGDKMVAGGSVTVYQVAELGDDLSYRLVNGFEESGIDVSDPSSAELPTDLAAVLPAGASALTAEIGESGTVYFGDLPLGLYLVVQVEPAQGYQAISPFVVCIPTEYEEGWEYDVDATPKMEASHAPQPNVPGAPTVPKTGEDTPAAGAIAMGGCTLVAAGAALLACRRKARGVHGLD